MNNIEHNYLKLLNDILVNGVTKSDRTGTGTKSVFGRQIRHDMSLGFPLLTTKKMAWKTMVTELLWFLRGDTNIKYLVDNNCHIWDGDAYKNYCKNADEGTFSRKWLKLEESFDGFFTNEEYSLYTQEEFINKIKTDDEFAKKWGDLGPVYGKQWRDWGRKNVTNYDLKDVKGSDQHRVIKAIENGEDVTKYGVKIEYQNNSIDQIQNLINDLKTNPDSRRLIVNAWNVGELDSMVLPPCHYGFQVYTKELTIAERIQWVMKNTDVEMENLAITERAFHPSTPQRSISLMWNQRSVDTFLGLPFNIASYGLLLEIIAKAVNMVPDELIGNLGDTHLYLNHIKQAKEQLTRQPYPLPTLNINTEWWPTESGECGIGPIDAVAVFNGFSNESFCKCLLEEDIQLSNYESHPAIKAPLSN